MQEIINRLIKFNEDRDWSQFHTPKNLIMALSVEVAELMERWQWLSDEEIETQFGFDGNKDYEHFYDEIGNEIADIFIYALILSYCCGYNPAKIIHRKININSFKYPVEKCKGKSVKWNQL